MKLQLLIFLDWARSDIFLRHLAALIRVLKFWARILLRRDRIDQTGVKQGLQSGDKHLRLYPCYSLWHN